MSVNMTRYDLATHGSVLATREHGRAVGREVQDALAETPGLVLTFSGIEVASPPFLDELVRGVQSVLRGGDANRLLVVAGYNPDVKESLEMVLERHKLALAALSEDQVELLGGTRQLKETLREAQNLGEFTAPELAERLAVKLPNLHQRLKALSELGAVAREADETAERGKRHRYRAAAARDVPAEAITTSV